MIEERTPLPESMGQLFATAWRAYTRRMPLYVAIALAAIATEAILTFAFPKSAGMLTASAIVCESFIAAFVTIGVVADLNIAATRPGARAIASAALARWWIVAGANAIVSFAGNVIISGTIDGDSSGLGYFLILPVAVIVGSLNFATVIAAVDVKTRPELLVFSSIGRSMMLSFARANFGRMVVLSLIAIMPTLIETVVRDVLQTRHIGASDFLGFAPLDVFVTGPLQAVFTLFYLDFVRRAAATSP